MSFGVKNVYSVVFVMCEDEFFVVENVICCVVIFVCIIVGVVFFGENFGDFFFCSFYDGVFVIFMCFEVIVVI